MTREQIVDKLKTLVQPYMPEPEKVASITPSSDFLEDLDINSAHLVDIILDIEDIFDVEISDDDAEEMLNISKTVDVIQRKIEP